MDVLAGLAGGGRQPLFTVLDHCLIVIFGLNTDQLGVGD